MCKRHQSERNNKNIRPQRAELMPKIHINFKGDYKNENKIRRPIN